MTWLPEVFEYIVAVAVFTLCTTSDPVYGTPACDSVLAAFPGLVILVAGGKITV